MALVPLKSSTTPEQATPFVKNVLEDIFTLETPKGGQEQTGVDKREGATVVSPARPIEKPDPRVGVFTSGGAIFRQESFTSNVIDLTKRAYELTQIPQDDKDFWVKQPDEIKQKYTEGLTGEFELYVLRARSLEDVEYRRQRALKQQADKETIDEFAEDNLAGTLLVTMGALSLDPASWVSVPGRMSVIKGMVDAGRAIRNAEGQRISTSILPDELASHAAHAAIYELPAQLSNIDRDISDLVLNVTANMALSPIINKAFPTVKNLSMNLSNAVRDVNLPQNKIQLNPSNSEAPDLSGSADRIDNLVDTRLSEIEANKLDTKEVESFNQKIGKTISNFMDRSWLTNPSVAGDFKRVLTEGDNKYAEFVLKDIISDGSGQYNQNLSAADYKHTYDHKYTTAVDDLRFMYHEYIESQINPDAYSTLPAIYKDSLLKQHKVEFDAKVVELSNTMYYMEQGTPEFSRWYSEQQEMFPLQMKAIERLQEQFEAIGLDSQNANVPGSQNVDYSRRGYLPRVTNREKFFERTLDSNDRQVYSRLYSDAFKKMGQNVKTAKLEDLNIKLKTAKDKLRETADAKAAEKLEAKVKDLELRLKTASSMDMDKYGKAGLDFFNKLRDSQYGHYTDMNSAITAADEARLMEIVGDQSIVDDILDAQRIMGEQKSKSARFKGRLDFDVNTQAEVNGKTYKLADLYDNSLDSLVVKYGREMAGRVALAKKGIRSEADWNDLSLRMVKGVGDLRQIDKLNENMKAIWDMMLNRPIEGAMSQEVRMFKEYTSSLLMGRSGLAQTADMAMVTAETGTLNTINALFKSFKIKDQVRKLPDGEKKEILRQTETLLSGRFSRDHILNNPVLDRIAQDTGGVQTKTIRNADRALGEISTSLYYLNGMNHIKAMEQGIGLRSSIARINDLITSNKDLARLADYGFDKKLIAEWKKNLDNGNIVKGEFGGIVDLNLPKWKNRTEAEKAAVALRKWNASMIQETIIGENVLALQKNIGGLLFHILQFPIIAMQKQTQKNIRHMDAQTLTFAISASIMGTAIGYIQYGIRNLLAGYDWDDRDITLEEALKAGMMYNPAIGTAELGINTLAAIGAIPREYAPSSFFTEDEGFGGFDPRALLNATTAVQGVSRPISGVSSIFQGLAGEQDPDEIARSIQLMLPLGNTFLLEGFFQSIKPLTE